MSRFTPVLFLLVLVLNACSDTQPTPEDRNRYREIQQQFGRSYEFSIEDIYLRADRKAGEPTQTEAAEIVRAFWFDASGRPRDNTNLAYLNMYSSAGFRFQAYYDRAYGRIAFGKTEHH